MKIVEKTKIHECVCTTSHFIFYKNMSIIDLLFNEGPNSKNILMKNNEKI